MFLTKIWMVSSLSCESEDVDESDETLLDRLGRIMTVLFVSGVLRVAELWLRRASGAFGLESEYDE
jgi:hypothetical protein